MKTLLTLLLLLSSNIIFADEEAKKRGAFGDIFDMGMTEQDIGTQTPNIDDGKDLFQVQLALAYAARDTAMLEKALGPNDSKVKKAKRTTTEFAQLAIASRLWNDMQPRMTKFYTLPYSARPKYEDYQAYIKSVNIYDDDTFMPKSQFQSYVNWLAYGTEVFNGERSNSLFYSDFTVQEILTNIRQSIYTTCSSCPMRSD